MENAYSLVECNALTKIYNQTNYAVNTLSLKLPAGKIIGLLGPNGSGKTTFIKLITGLILPTRGSIFIDGHAPGAYTNGVVSYLPDKSYFENWMKIQDCIDLFSTFYADFDPTRAREMLALLGLSPTNDYKTLSKGNKEKVQLIMAMARNAKLYVLDEPIAGVDPAAREYILNTILSNYSRESTIIISTHLLADIEQILDEFIFLKNGVCVAYNSVENSRNETGKSLDELFREVFKCY